MHITSVNYLQSWSLILILTWYLWVGNTATRCKPNLEDEMAVHSNGYSEASRTSIENSETYDAWIEADDYGSFTVRQSHYKKSISTHLYMVL